VKVAQYEVLGNEAKSHVRTAGTIETLGFWFRTRLSDCQHSSIVPSAYGTDLSFASFPSTSYWACRN
jgi:hypothetical protein